MKDRRTAMAMVSPTVVIVALVFVYPLLVSLWTSFQYKVLSQPDLNRFYGLGNYQWLWKEPRFWDAFSRSIVFLVFTVALSIAVGMLVALLLDHYCSHWPWLKALYLVPMVVTPVVVALPAGEYHVKASNPAFSQALEFDLSVAAGGVMSNAPATGGRTSWSRRAHGTPSTASSTGCTGTTS